MSDELALPKKSFKFVPKVSGLAARKEQVATELQLAGKTLEKSPSDLEHRIGIVFDDSGSMHGQAIADAHAGTEEFLRSCEPNKTAVAIYPLNAEKLELCSNLPAVALMVKKIGAIGGTPLIERLARMLTENNLTRAIAFSDGSWHRDERCYAAVVAKGIPVDTVYIADTYVDPIASEAMRKLARDTDGIYLQFERGKSNFRTAFKYLSPGLRYMLADKSFVDKLQGK